MPVVPLPLEIFKNPVTMKIEQAYSLVHMYSADEENVPKLRLSLFSRIITIGFEFSVSMLK